MRAPRRLRKQTVGDLRAVVDETIALFHRLAWVADQIYGEEGQGTSRRGLLRGLARFGPQTVPELARARALRRQSIQPIVDDLAARGLVELVANPRHARSPRVRITTQGTALVARMDRVDRRVLAAVGRGLDPAAIATTAATLRALRSRFEITLRWRGATETTKATPTTQET